MKNARHLDSSALTLLRPLAVLALTGAISTLTCGYAVAQCSGTPTHQETYVDPAFVDCNNTGGPMPPGTGWWGAAWGGGGASNDTFDLDTFVGVGEDTDGDAVCGSIQSAINSTLTGGIVHVLVPGVYREALTVSRSVTIRGGEGMDVILDGGSGNCTAAGPANGPMIDVTASNAAVRIENLTVRGAPQGTGIANGIQVSGSDTTVTVVDCNVQDNEVAGLSVTGGSDTNLNVIRTQVLNNETGISHLGTGNVLTLTDSVVSGSASDGISGSGEIGWGTIVVERSQVSNNGRHGINIDQNLSATGGSLVVHESGVVHNVEHGVHASITNGNGATTVTVSNSNVSANGEDGLHLTGGDNHSVNLGDNRINMNGDDGVEVSQTWPLSIWRNMFTQNVTFCVNNATATPVTCDPGYNVFVPVVGTCMANTPPAGACPLLGGNNQG